MIGQREKPASPSCERPCDFHWKADDGEILSRQFVEVGQLLQMTVADLTARLVPLPNDRGVACFCKYPVSSQEISLLG
jgi:hypothetical protein